MSAQDYTVDASAVGCCRGAHVWDSPDGFVPEDGRQVTCRVCPATARARQEGQVERMLRRVIPESADLAAKAVIEAALREAIDVTHEVGTEAETDGAVLVTLRDAIWTAARALGPPWCERHNCAEAAYAVSLPTCLHHHDGNGRVR